MLTSHAFGTRYFAWRNAPPETARRISGKFQTIMISLWGLLTVSTAMMAHLDFDLADQIELHAKNALLFLGLALVVALLVPTRSHARWLIQATAISFFGGLGFLLTAAFNTF